MTLPEKIAAGGVFCPNDICAIGLLDTLRLRFGQQIPEEICIVGYDNIPQAGWQQVDLTTIEQSVDAVASATVDLLKRRIEDPGADENHVVLPAKLIERGTTR